MGLASAYREPALRELMLVQELLRGRDVGAVLDVHRQQFIEEVLDDLALHEVHLDLADKGRDEEDVAHDINGYAKAPPSFRVWAGGTVESLNIELLLPWLDWAYSEVRKSYA